LTAQVNKTNEEINRLPPMGKNGEVIPATACRWNVLKYQKEIAAWDQPRLVEEILNRFSAEPNRYPKWLQYMIFHFSGMRYKSAHGSWASPRDLLEMVKIEEYEKWVKTVAKTEDLDRDCTQAINDLEQRKLTATQPVEEERLKWQIIALNDRFNRQTALIKYKTPQIIQEVRALSDDKVLDALKVMKEIFPPWVWKEIVSRTDLRLETTDANWETLTPDEQKARWEWKSGYWREIMEAWEGKDITGWRQQHEMTLSLIVTKAVCNEIAEHIQHLRGLTPTGGLTAKPPWYLNEQNHARKNPPQTGSADLPYFKPPGQQSEADFKPGASILWLGWVYQKPNPWQIAHPLDGVSTLPPRDIWSQYDWNYRQEGSEYVREANISIQPQPGTGKKGKGRPGDSQSIKNWLRWTHEATVVEVAEMAGGVKYVLTFETGQIGLRLRTLKELLNNAYVYVGYIPPAPLEPENLAKMLAREKLLPAKPVSVSRDQSFEMPEFIQEELPVVQAILDEKTRIWQSLTPREQQVVTLICSRIKIAEIAKRMDLHRATVKKHLHNAMRKFGVHNQLGLRQAVAEIKSA
jgi:DNA-binding CsgD family transcriptional regulator